MALSGARTPRQALRRPLTRPEALYKLFISPVEIRRSPDYIAFIRMSLGVNGCLPPRTRSLQHLGLGDRSADV